MQVLSQLAYSHDMRQRHIPLPYHSSHCDEDEDGHLLRYYDGASNNVVHFIGSVLGCRWIQGAQNRDRDSHLVQLASDSDHHRDSLFDSLQSR